jgi:hypothetical protein
MQVLSWLACSRRLHRFFKHQQALPHMADFFLDPCLLDLRYTPISHRIMDSPGNVPGLSCQVHQGLNQTFAFRLNQRHQLVPHGLDVVVIDYIGLIGSDGNCGYTGPYVTKDGVITDNPELDQCDATLGKGCISRFGEGNPLPFGGFPAVSLIARS